MMSEFVSLQDACMATGCSYQRLYHACLRGSVRARRDGHRWYVRRSDLHLVRRIAEA